MTILTHVAPTAQPRIRIIQVATNVAIAILTGENIPQWLEDVAGMESIIDEVEHGIGDPLTDDELEMLFRRESVTHPIFDWSGNFDDVLPEEQRDDWIGA